MMRLTDLDPKWWAEAGRHGQGVSFDCPHCVRAQMGSAAVLRDPPTRLGVAFANPIDGGEPVKLGLEVNLHNVHELRLYDVPPGFRWRREGDTFEALTLSPSVDCSASGHWHGFVKNGVIS